MELDIYDISGRKVKTVVSKNLGVGSHQAIWDGYDDFGNHVATGVYFCRLQAMPVGGAKQAFTAVHKMMMLR